MRLQVDDEKVPARPFSLRCPKCQSLVHAQPPVNNSQEQAAVAVSAAPSNGSRPAPKEEAQPAPQYRPEAVAENNGAGGAAAEKESSSSGDKDLLRMLATLLQRGTQAVDSSRPGSRLEWEARRVLICAGEVAQREMVARTLAAGDYQVYVAENKAQAFERMRDERIDIIILSPDFDMMEQGAAFITREVSSLRPAERRRLFLVQLADSGRTSDAHAAFINNVNLIVNPCDIEKMPRAIERALRDYNDLYRNFNDALGVRAI